jgi:multidrug resistance efflux pump
MKKHAGYLLTGGLVLIAVLVIVAKYRAYVINPWTRDGQVRAYVVQVTSRVTAPIVKLPIVDNQFVKAGDLLFELDPRTFQAALDQAKANLEVAKASAKEAQDLATRAQQIRKDDPGAIPKEELIQRQNNLLSAKASVEQAEAALESAKLNLEFAQVKAPVDGYVTNLTLRLGTQAVANQPALALVDVNSFWVHGFFRENYIANIREGDQAVITLMTYHDQPITGHVQSIGWGIAQDDGSTSHDLLPKISPTFEWIRLAQRVPVRIQLDKIPEGIKLRVGTTCSVLVMTGQTDTNAGANVPAVPRAWQ